MKCKVLLAHTLPPEEFLFQVETITQPYDFDFNIAILQMPIIVCCGFLIGIEISLQLPQFNAALNASSGLGGSIVTCKKRPIKLKPGKASWWDRAKSPWVIHIFCNKREHFKVTCALKKMYNGRGMKNWDTATVPEGRSARLVCITGWNPASPSFLSAHYGKLCCAVVRHCAALACQKNDFLDQVLGMDIPYKHNGTPICLCHVILTTYASDPFPVRMFISIEEY